MSRVPANAARGEVMIAGLRLRPSFAALVAAEAELGPLFTLVERASEGMLTLAETTALLWHVHVPDGPAPSRDGFGEALLTVGLAGIAPALRQVLGQIVKGGG